MSGFGMDSNNAISRSYDPKDKALRVDMVSSLVKVTYDAMLRSEPAATTELFEYFVNGLAGTKVFEVLITYTDATRSTLLSVESTEI